MTPLTRRQLQSDAMVDQNDARMAELAEHRALDFIAEGAEAIANDTEAEWLSVLTPHERTLLIFAAFTAFVRANNMVLRQHQNATPEV